MGEVVLVELMINEQNCAEIILLIPRVLEVLVPHIK